MRIPNILDEAMRFDVFRCPSGRLYGNDLLCFSCHEKLVRISDQPVRQEKKPEIHRTTIATSEN